MGESLGVVEISQIPQSMTTLGFQMISVEKSKRFDYISATITSPIEKGQHYKRNRNNINRVHLSDTPEIKNTKQSALTQLPQFTLDQVSNHDTPSDCWVVIYDRIYDITSFLREHPGGDEVMLEYAGRDATLPFKGVGHSMIAEQSLKPYLEGILVEEERIWSRYHTVDNSPQ